MAPALVAGLIHFWGQLDSDLGRRQGASSRVVESDFVFDFCFLRRHFLAGFAEMIIGFL